MAKLATQARKEHHASATTRGGTTTYQLGEVISVAFEQALSVTSDARQAAELASVVVERLLAREAQRRYISQLASL